MVITGGTVLFGIVGDPVAPLRSPALFNAAFARLGRDAVLVPMHVPAGGLAAAWAGLSALRNLAGLVVTMPHKEAVLPLLQALGPTARLTGTVNTVRRRAEGGWEGEMFDGAGFVDGLTRAGHGVWGARVLQVGCGAAGRAIAHALAGAGVAELVLHDAAPGRAAALAGSVQAAFPATSAVPATGAAPPDLAGHGLVVNATPLGLRPQDPMPFDPAGLLPHQVVADVIPNPEMTPLLHAAHALGCQVVTGRAMHEGQARLAAAYLGIEGWDG